MILIMKKVFSLSLLLLIHTSVSASLLPQTPIHKRILWHTDPAHEATFSWTTLAETKVNRVYLDTESHKGRPSAYGRVHSAQQSGPFTQGTAAYYHHVQVKNLLPSTTYYFVMESDGIVSQEFHFQTAPADDQESFELLFGGDSRSDRTARRGMNDRIRELFSARPGILALVHGGDYISNGDSWNDWSEWLEDHEGTMTTKGRMLPLIPTRGNHETNELFFNQVFAWPGEGGKGYFTTQMGKFICVTLNTEISMAGDQKSWLEKELRQHSSSARWMVTNYHRPAFPAVKWPSGARQHFVPIFEKYLVDISFESDGHALKQTVPIRQEKKDMENGVIYVGEGGLGVKQRAPLQKLAWFFWSPGYATSGHHVQHLEVTPSKLTYSVYLMNGKTFGQFELLPRERIQRNQLNL